MSKEWVELLELQASSGTNVRSFCRLHGLSEANFYYYRRKQKAHREASGFVEVASPPAPVSRGGADFWVELRYPSGVEMRLSGEVSVDVLLRLVHV